MSILDVAVTKTSVDGVFLLRINGSKEYFLCLQDEELTASSYHGPRTVPIAEVAKRSGLSEESLRVRVMEAA